jgi:mono/diheme cytochrome c family protein
MMTRLTSYLWLLFAASPALAAPVAQVERGAYLAKLGDCVACHSAPKGKPFAGGLPMATPVGTIYATNITPDGETGIGRWSAHDFEQAVRRGVSRDGHNLYPAMPYPSYAKLRDDDVAALYAYFMQGVAPVRQANRASAIRFPLNMRWPLAVWNVMYVDHTVFQDKPGQSAAWNRGAYLTQGLGHCGSCHTPRGVGFQEKALDDRGSAFLSGAHLDGWFASDLTAEHRAGLGRWTSAELQAFLRTGSNRHATAFGPMTDVVNNSTQYLNDADLHAMATYLGALPAQHPAPRQVSAVPAAAASTTGGRLYNQYCAHCHSVDGKGAAPWLAPLAGNPNMLAASAGSLINVTLNGTRDLVIQGVPAPYPMPAFGALLNDRELADVLTFARRSWGNNAAPVAPDDVTKMRRRAKEGK